MEYGRVGTLHLTGEDVIGFVNSFFYPSIEEINEHEAIRSSRNERISLRKNENGFLAEISDLDLSFLDEINTEEHVSVMVTVSVNLKTQKPVFNPTCLPKSFAKMSISTSKTSYTVCETSEIAKIAA